MDKSTQLFIRACKSRSAKFRISQLQDRFYFTKGCSAATKQNAAIVILSKIIDQYIGWRSTTEMIDAFAPSTYILCEDERDYHTRVYDALISRIRLTTVDKFEGLSTPRRFKRDLV